MIETIVTITSLIAAYIMSTGNENLVKYSMLLWFIGSAMWFYVGYKHHMIGLMVVNVGYFILEGKGLYEWVRRDLKK